MIIRSDSCHKVGAMIVLSFSLSALEVEIGNTVVYLHHRLYIILYLTTTLLLRTTLYHTTTSHYIDYIIVYDLH